MGKAHGQGAVFRIGDGGGMVRDISASVAGVRGLPGAPAVVDVTSLTQGPALARVEERVRFVVEGDWDDTPLTGSAPVLGMVRSKGTAVAFEFGPAGGGVGAVRYSGVAWCARLEVDAPASREARFRAEFAVEGAVDVGVFA